MNLGEIRRQMRQFGAVKTMQDVAARGLNQVMVMRVLKCIVLEDVDPEFLKFDRRYEARFIEYDELAALSQGHPEYELAADFLRQAAARGDRCYGFLEGDVIANYGFYAPNATPIDLPGLMLHFPPTYVYQYKGFTNPAHRGRRLHAIGMALALQRYCEHGYKGLVAYVDWNNFSSLKSVYRMGYKDAGSIYIAKAFGRYLIHADGACRRAGFGVQPARAVSAAAL